MAQTPRPDEVRQPDRPGGATAAVPLDDPLLARRRRIARWAVTGQRVGYLLYGLALVSFAAAMATDLPQLLVGVVIAAMVLGSVLLAPAIVVGYGVRAADREDRERAGR